MVEYERLQAAISRAERWVRRHPKRAQRNAARRAERRDPDLFAAWRDLGGEA